MAAHLRFDSKTGRVDPRTLHGEYTEDLLQLNDDAVVQFRLNTLLIVRTFNAEIETHKRFLKAIARKYHEGAISQSDYALEVDSTNKELEKLHAIVQAQTGELPLPSLKAQRLGVTLLPK